MTRNYSTMLNSRDESKHPCLFTDLRGKAFSLSPTSVMLAETFHQWPYHVEEILLLLVFWFFWGIMKWCWILSNAFSVSIEIINFFPFALLIWYITLIDFFIFNHSCIPEINLFRVWSVILLDSVLLYFIEDFYINVHKGYWSLILFPCDNSIGFWFQDSAGLTERVRKYFWIRLRRMLIL